MEYIDYIRKSSSEYPEKEIFLVGDFHCYFEKTEDKEAVKRCFEVLTEYCIEHEKYELDCVEIVIKSKKFGDPYRRPSIGIKWHVRDDQY